MVLVPKQSRFDTLTENNRGEERVNSRIPVLVEWEDASQTFRIEGKTKDSSLRGCLVIAPRCVGVGQKLRLTNRINQKSCEAVVIWHEEDSRANWELGLQLQDPAHDFWEMDF
jgi:hypothetical protein